VIEEIEADGLKVPPFLKDLMEEEKRKVEFYLGFFEKFNDLNRPEEYDQKQEADQPIKNKNKKQATGSKKRK